MSTPPPPEETLSDRASPLPPGKEGKEEWTEEDAVLQAVPLGEYVIATRAGVTEGVDRRQRVLCILDEWDEVTVAEVARHEDRLRARITTPIPGWLSLSRSSDGRKFAVPREEAAKWGRSNPEASGLGEGMTQEELEALSAKALRTMARGLGLSLSDAMELDTIGVNAYVRWIVAKRAELDETAPPPPIPVELGCRCRAWDEPAKLWRLGTVTRIVEDRIYVITDHYKELEMAFYKVEGVAPACDSQPIADLQLEEWTLRSGLRNEEGAKRHSLARTMRRESGFTGKYRREGVAYRRYLSKGKPRLPTPSTGVS
eukprot:Hpha_TRINITY_DN14114_c0_g1::TRINITY_DN14114_c0_g1_i1::g.10535::m.10535